MSNFTKKDRDQLYELCEKAIKCLNWAEQGALLIWLMGNLPDERREDSIMELGDDAVETFEEQIDFPICIECGESAELAYYTITSAVAGGTEYTLCCKGGYYEKLSEIPEHN